MTDQHFFKANESLEGDPLLYEECGLDNIYLLNGFSKEVVDGEEYISIADVDGLHEAIGLYIVLRRKAPSGKEIRFLREELDKSQAELGEILGVSSQSVARWEKGQSEPPGPAILALRMIYILSIAPSEERHRIMDEIIVTIESLATADETSDLARFSYCKDEWSDDRMAVA